MACTISTSTSSGITLTSANNPVMVTSTGKIIANVGGAAGHGGIAPIVGAALYAPGPTGWTISNSGTIDNTSEFESAGFVMGRNYAYAVGGTVTNLLGGLITGQNAVWIEGSGVLISNASGGTITGNAGDGIDTFGGIDTVVNGGIVTGSSGLGVQLYDAGSVINLAGGTISGGGGVLIGGKYLTPGTYNLNDAVYAGTVNNAGTIIATGTRAAVAFYNYFTGNRLITNPGAVFGGVAGAGGGVLELASGAGVGTLSGFGVSIISFTTLQFDAGAKWKITGSASASSLGTAAITGFATNDTIDVTGFVAATDTFTANQLILTNLGGGQHVTLHIQGSFSSGSFQLIGDGDGGTDLLTCFAAGTRIATCRGPVRVEDLAVGDIVPAYFAGSVPIHRINRRHVNCAHHPEPRKVWPVRVAAGAFGPGRPRHDLFLSPNHAVLVGGDLIPIRCLVNEVSIAQTPAVEVTYYHVELAEHDLLLSEGLLTESYLDTGDRSNFANGSEPMRLYPDFAARTADAAALWETKGCAPLVVHGSRLQAARIWVNGLAGGVAQGSAGPPEEYVAFALADLVTAA
jgi:hypothetical protein